MRHLTPVLGGGPVSPGSQVPSALVKELKGAWWNPEQLRKHTESSTLPWHAYELTTVLKASLSRVSHHLLSQGPSLWQPDRLSEG